MTPSELSIVAHSLGIDIIKATISHKKKDRVLPKLYYRNYYNCNPSHPVIIELILAGIMEKNHTPDFFRVTEKGITVFIEQYNLLILYKQKKDQDLQYLIDSINAYCFLSNYKFGNDNAGHVLMNYFNYIVEKHYVSHTTRDCIVKFYKDLRRFHKLNLIHPLT